MKEEEEEAKEDASADPMEVEEEQEEAKTAELETKLAVLGWRSHSYSSPSPNIPKHSTAILIPSSTAFSQGYTKPSK